MRRSIGALSYGPRSTHPLRAILEVLTGWLTSWRQRRTLAHTYIQLTALRQCALSAPDDMFRDYLIVSVNGLLADLQARGIINLAERHALAREWIKDYVRGCLPALYRDKNAEAVDRLGRFLKAS
jgi:hypothetical protein